MVVHQSGSSGGATALAASVAAALAAQEAGGVGLPLDEAMVSTALAPAASSNREADGRGQPEARPQPQLQPQVAQVVADQAATEAGTAAVVAQMEAEALEAEALEAEALAAGAEAAAAEAEAVARGNTSPSRVSDQEHHTVIVRQHAASLTPPAFFRALIQRLAAKSPNRHLAAGTTADMSRAKQGGRTKRGNRSGRERAAVAQGAPGANGELLVASSRRASEVEDELRVIDEEDLTMRLAALEVERQKEVERVEIERLREFERVDRRYLKKQEQAREAAMRFASSTAYASSPPPAPPDAPRTGHIW